MAESNSQYLRVTIQGQIANDKGGFEVIDP